MAKYIIERGDTHITATIVEAGPSEYEVSLDGVSTRVRAVDLGEGRLLLESRGLRVEVVCAPGAADHVVEVALGGERHKVQVYDPRSIRAVRRLLSRGAEGPAELKAPIPGLVVKVLVKPGEQVEKGAGVLILEAMKMENELKAPRSGTVKEVLVAEGDAVEANATLARIS